METKPHPYSAYLPRPTAPTKRCTMLLDDGNRCEQPAKWENLVCLDDEIYTVDGRQWCVVFICDACMETQRTWRAELKELRKHYG